MAAKWPENGTAKKTSRDLARRFEEIWRCSTLSMVQVGLPRVGASPWCLRRSRGSPEKGNPTSYSKG